MREKSSVTYGQQLGAAIRGARTTLGLTQQQLADALDVKRASVSLWENGDVPGPLNLTALRELLGPALVEPAPPMLADERGYLRGRAEQIALHMVVSEFHLLQWEKRNSNGVNGEGFRVWLV